MWEPNQSERFSGWTWARGPQHTAKEGLTGPARSPDLFRCPWSCGANQAVFRVRPLVAAVGQGLREDLVRTQHLAPG